MSHTNHVWAAKLELSNINFTELSGSLLSVCVKLRSHQEASYNYTFHKFVQGKIKLKKKDNGMMQAF